ncbi:hypothetical protein ACH5RR_013108 [Cinchona calisaya]|uniref:Uncharacterized protein n=1 Tax=Cinchona calisaya TaxID=153742 RepID=A0ABD2ZZ52_9GENT
MVIHMKNAFRWDVVDWDFDGELKGICISKSIACVDVKVMEDSTIRPALLFSQGISRERRNKGRNGRKGGEGEETMAMGKSGGRGLAAVWVG